MKYHDLANGDRMPLLGLGTWKAAPGEVGAAVSTALELGYRHLDCASDYGNEKEVGDGIRMAIAEGLVTREDLWVRRQLSRDLRMAGCKQGGGKRMSMVGRGL